MLNRIPGRVARPKTGLPFHAPALVPGRYSSDPPVLTWTPVVTFATPGDVDVEYDPQIGLYTKRGLLVFLLCRVFATVTWLTASGNLRITGLPFAAAASPAAMAYVGTMRWSGINKASYTQIAPRVLAGESHVEFTASGMGQATDSVETADMTSGNDVELSFQLTYAI